MTTKCASGSGDEPQCLKYPGFNIKSSCSQTLEGKALLPALPGFPLCLSPSPHSSYQGWQPKLCGITFYNELQLYQLTPCSVTTTPLPLPSTLQESPAQTSPTRLCSGNKRTGIITFVTASQVHILVPCLQGGSQPQWWCSLGK